MRQLIASTYAEFASGGAIAPEKSQIPTETVDPRALVWPDHAYAVRFRRRQEAVIDGRPLVGEWHNGPWHYRNGKIYTAETLPLDMVGRHNVLFTMESASRCAPARVCETCTGRVILIHPDDVAVTIP